MDTPLGLLFASRSTRAVSFDKETIAFLLKRHKQMLGRLPPRILLVDDIVKTGMTFRLAYSQVCDVVDQLWETSSSEVVRTLALVVPDSKVQGEIPHYSVRQDSRNTNVLLPYGLG